MTRLAVIETHPVQYHAPVYRELQAGFGIDVTAIYASDFSVTGYRDPEFGETFAWDTDLLAGYDHRFLTTIARGGSRDAANVAAEGLQQALVDVQPDAILLTGYSPRFYRQAFRSALQVNVPVLFRAETTDHARKRNWLKHWVRDNALRYVYKRCAGLLYIGERSRAHYLRLGVDPDQLLFSPYCVDVRTFQCGEEERAELRAGQRAQLDIAGDDLVVLFSGKLVARKDPARIIEAVRLLTGGARPVVVFLGSGALRSQLEVAASIDPPVQIRFAGFQNQGALSAYYHAADCLILPSVEDETWGLVVNEALAHGLPAVVSNAVGCAPDLIDDGHTGAIFDAGDAAGLAAALRRVLPLVNNAAARQHCRTKVNDYSVTNAARGIAAACERALRRS
ncbi:MAG TPA: glycosyltransferase family 4 protein [Longimicrobiales bacterium]